VIYGFIHRFLFATMLLLSFWVGALQGEYPLPEWQEPVTVAMGEAYRGPWRMNRSDFRFVDDATVAINDAGVIAVTWADQARQDLLLQIYEPDGAARFEEPVNVSRSPEIFSWLPRVLLGPGEGADVHVLWQEIVFSGGSHGGEAYFARSSDGGRTFDNPRNLSRTEAGVGKGRLSREAWHNGSLDLVMGDAGALYIAWTEYEGGLWFTRSGDGGERFSAPLRVAGDDNEPARAPSLAVGGNEVWLAWTTGENQEANIRIARSGDGGSSFGEAQQIAPQPRHADAPGLALASDGTLHLVYGESLPEPPLRYRVLYTQRAPGAAEFSAPRPIAETHEGKFDSIGFPELVLDGEDRLYVLWEIFPHHNRRPMGLGLTGSVDGGNSFAPAMVLPHSLSGDLGYSGSQQGLLTRKLAVNQGGEVVVANSYFKRGKRSTVLLWRSRGDL